MTSCSPDALAKLLQGLNHADPRVRYVALVYLEREVSQAGVVDAVLTSLTTTTKQVQISLATRILATAPLTEEQLERFVAWTQATPETEGRYPWSWTHILGHENLRQWGRRLSTDPRVPPQNRAALEQAVKMLDLSPDECWQHILDLDAKLDQLHADGELGQAYDDADQRRSELLRVGSWHGECRARARQVLDAWVPGQDDSLAISAAELLGERADAECLPTVLETLSRADPDEYEVVWESMHMAADTIDGATDLPLLLRHIAQARDDNNISIVKLIARADAPDTTQVIIDLYRGTDRESLRRSCVEGLLYRCELSDEARTLVLAEAKRDSDEDDIWDLPEEVAVLSTLMGWEGPEVDALRGRVGSDEERRAHRRALRQHYERFMSEVNERDFDLADGWGDDLDEPAYVPDGDAMAPYVRAEPKVGRNDPCPCGSGKKYKKCCGK